MKITKNMLNNYRHLKREIPILELELENMKKGDNGFNNSTVFDYRDGFPRPQSVVGFDWPLYEHRKKVLDEKKARVDAVKRWINSIDDGQTRCVFRMFYMDGMSWLQIADKLKCTGDHREDYPRICIRDYYLKKMGIA
ncbi:DUF1492 domain-containing protein [Clostridium sp. FS41]|uniref:DUF1492 domain-containing protein n=1 Tax=Clostridium sp. FS41 TaxID=1609975 RepID=UPI00061E70A7|nr:DUF1492 domain-containing protein [Clostridium sp. FS41]KJJ66689.1 hypothetical protein CLFS41_50580 [Clostridium sp. FS41]